MIKCPWSSIFFCIKKATKDAAKCFTECGPRNDNSLRNLKKKTKLRRINIKNKNTGQCLGNFFWSAATLHRALRWEQPSLHSRLATDHSTSIYSLKLSGNGFQFYSIHDPAEFCIEASQLQLQLMR